MRPVPQSALDFIEGAEGDRLTAYRDQTGKLTIGRGHTGPEVVDGMSITEAQSAAFEFSDATHAASKLALAVKDAAIQALAEHQYAALVSFAFNLGVTPSDRIWGLVNRGQLAAVPTEMMRYDHAHVNGQLVEVPGLFHRRSAEVTLWKTADVDSSLAVAQSGPEAPPSSFTRAVDTPPTAFIGKAWGTSKSVVSGCLATCATGAAAIAPQIKSGADAVNNAIQPYVGQSSILQGISSHLALVAAAASAAALGFVFLKNRTSAQ